MRDDKGVVLTLAGVVCALLSGCAANTAPRGWLPEAESAQTEAFGAWTEIKYMDSASVKPRDVDGELIAVDNDSLYLLDLAGVRAYPLSGIPRGKVTLYESGASALGYWTLLGTLSTASHGFVLIISAPLWMLTGIVATANASYVSQFDFPDNSWTTLRRYARFPQGLPQPVDRSALKPRFIPLKE